jgi:hypothetical protein
MSESSGVREPILNRPARIVGVAAGVVTLVAGGVAVFRTSNELGSTALVAAGVVIASLAVFANRIEAVEAAGIRLELERQALRARQEARRARAAGENDRADELERRAQSLLAAASRVGSRYEQLRTSEPSGWDRTSRMEGVLREARALDTEVLTASDVAGIFATGSDGNRIAALALVEGDPRLATADVLTEAITHSRSTFEQYHALVAAESGLTHLPAEDRARIGEAVESILAGPLGERSSDRRTVARRVLETLARLDGH